MKARIFFPREDAINMLEAKLLPLRKTTLNTMEALGDLTINNVEAGIHNVVKPYTHLLNQGHVKNGLPLYSKLNSYCLLSCPEHYSLYADIISLRRPSVTLHQGQDH